MIDKDKIILRIENLTKCYIDKTAVLNDLNLQIREKEFLCILGPSGCGKTTLIKCIGGFENYEGNIFVDDAKVDSPSMDRIMVFQDYNQLFPWKTVEKNIQYGLKCKGIKNKQELDMITDKVLAKVKLADVRKKYPHQLSGGMKQRVAIAKALALHPRIILMDEPFAALDAITRNRLVAELQRISVAEDTTFVFVTHNIAESITLGTRIIVMSDRGRIIFDEANTLPRPVTPASDGYGALWGRLNSSLQTKDAI